MATLLNPAPHEWPAIRERGKAAYVRDAGLKEFALRYGILIWALFELLVPLLLAIHAGTVELFLTRRLWLGIAIHAALWPIAGILLGHLLWRKYERRWRDAAE